MSRKAWLAGLSIALMSLGATAQEPDEDEAAPQQRRHIQVLQHPYEIASFYRSSQSSGDAGYFGYQSPYEFQQGEGRYPIAGYYRSGGASNPRGYGRFWNSGARHHRQTIWISPAGHRRRSFGHRGELFLFAPTFLAPVVPMNHRTFER